jgi:HPt (histidine-containing phosphotransfer) domain-containing protein
MENSEKNTAAATTTAEDLYDLSMLEEMDDIEYMLEMLTVLLMETPKDIREMKEALLAGKTEIVCQKAHKLKSSAGVIQADKLTKMLENIEALGKKGVVNDELISFVESAVQQYKGIEKSLASYMEALK